MKLYHKIQNTVYIVSYDEIDEYVENYFKGKDVPLNVPISFKDICQYLKDNNAKCVIICVKKSDQGNRIYTVLDDFEVNLLMKNQSLIITHYGIISTIDDHEILGNYVEA